MKKSRNQQIKNIINFTKLDARFKSILNLRKEIKQFLKKVNETKQSLNCIYDFVQNARKYCEVNTKKICKLNIFQVQNCFLTIVLLLQCNYVIFFEYLIASRENLYVNLISNKKDCKTLVEEF